MLVTFFSVQSWETGSGGKIRYTFQSKAVPEQETGIDMYVISRRTRNIMLKEHLRG